MPALLALRAGVAIANMVEDEIRPAEGSIRAPRIAEDRSGPLDVALSRESAERLGRNDAASTGARSG